VRRRREAPLRLLRGHRTIMYYTYLLENQDDKSWYIGFTSNLRQRVKEHQESKGGRTTSLKKHWKLIYYEAYLMKDDAIGREKFLKSGSGRTYLKKNLRNYLKL
jgi:putative endonuclease